MRAFYLQALALCLAAIVAVRSSRPSGASPSPFAARNEQMDALRRRIQVSKSAAFANQFDDASRNSREGLHHFLDETFELPSHHTDARRSLRRLAREKAQEAHAEYPAWGQALQVQHEQAMLPLRGESGAAFLRCIRPGPACGGNFGASRLAAMNKVKANDEHLRFHALSLYEHARAGGSSEGEAADRVTSNLARAAHAGWMDHYRGDRPAVAHNEDAW